MTAKVLVTGAGGYIGSAVCDGLLDAGYSVTGTDVLRFGARPLLPLFRHPAFEFIHCDLTNSKDRQAMVAEAAPDYVIHLAAIVGDPACKKEPELARKLNVDGSKALYELCAEKQAKRFIFASTCSNYGLSASDELLTETAALNPISLYAETKVEMEKWLMQQPAPGPKRIILRFGTAHGLSNRMRFDLTVNEFTKTIVEGQPLKVYDAETWRPYCHVRFFAQVMRACIESQTLASDAEVFNVGLDQENFRKVDLVEKIGKVTGIEPKVEYVGGGTDKRNYRVNFSKLQKAFNISSPWSVDRSIAEIANAVKVGVFSDKAPAYSNV